MRGGVSSIFRPAGWAWECTGCGHRAGGATVTLSRSRTAPTFTDAFGGAGRWTSATVGKVGNLPAVYVDGTRVIWERDGFWFALAGIPASRFDEIVAALRPASPGRHGPRRLDHRPRPRCQAMTAAGSSSRVLLPISSPPALPLPASISRPTPAADHPVPSMISMRRCALEHVVN